MSGYPIISDQVSEESRCARSGIPWFEYKHLHPFFGELVSRFNRRIHRHVVSVPLLSLIINSRPINYKMSTNAYKVQDPHPVSRTFKFARETAKQEKYRIAKRLISSQAQNT